MLCYDNFIMGKIVIEIPSGEDRRYVLDDAKQAKLLLSALDISAIRIKNNPASVSELEDADDLRLVKKSIAELKRNGGKTYKWDDVKAELGL